MAFLALTLLIFAWAAVTSSMQGRILGVVFLALVVWSLYPKWHLVSSLAIVVLLSFFEASFGAQEFVESLFSTYGGSGLWTIVAGFILASALEASNLARRMAYRIVLALGADPNRVIASVALASFAISVLSPSTTAKAFMMLPLCNGLVGAYSAEKGKSRFAAGVMIMAMAANNISATAFLTATVPNPISASYIRNASGIDLDWGGWLKMALPVSLIILVSAWLVCRWMFKPEAVDKAVALKQVEGLSKGLGGISRKEKTALAIFLVSVGLWIAEPVYGLNGGLISLALALLLFLPRIGSLKVRGFSGSIPAGSIALFAASLFLARSVDRWRALDPVAARIFQLFDPSDLPVFAFVSIVVLAAMLIHLFFTSTTVYATVMTPLIISLAKLRGLAPQFVALPIAFLTPLALILPVNTIPNIMFYSSGHFTQTQMIAYGTAVSIISSILILAVGIPYWHLIGFL